MEQIKKLKKLLKKNNNLSLLLIVMVIGIGYLFFFNSKSIFNYHAALKNTDINTVIEIDDRNVTLAKWVYCESTHEMEIELDIVNTTYDGNDDYVYQVINPNGEELTFTVMFTSPTISVIRISNVPENFTELRLSMSVDSETTDTSDIAKFYCNNESVEQIDTLDDYSSIDDYYVKKLNRYIQEYEKEIDNLNQQIADANTQVDDYNQLISNLNMQKSYAAADELTSINKQIADANKQLISLNNTISGYETSITDIEQKIADYEAIKKMYE